MRWMNLIVMASFVGIGALGVHTEKASAEGATVINWGHDDATCSAFCEDEEGEPFECVADGKLTIVEAPSGNINLNCTDADWLLDPPEKTIKVMVDCGFGDGVGVITPAGKVNFTCHG